MKSLHGKRALLASGAVILAAAVFTASYATGAGSSLLGAAVVNPCAAKTINPCAAKTINPCAAKTINPCAARTGVLAADVRVIGLATSLNARHQVSWT